jgi:hypothetical protein
MRLIVNCMFGDGPRTYWIAAATDADLRGLHDAMDGPQGAVVSIVARTSELGTESDLDADHERRFRAGAIQCITVERPFSPSARPGGQRS